MENYLIEEKYDLIYLMKLFDDFFAATSSYNDISNNLLMGQNRKYIFDIHKGHTDEFRFFSDVVDNQVYDLVFGKNKDNSVSNKRKFITFGLVYSAEVLKKDASGLKYPLSKKAVKIPYTFKFIHLLNKYDNNAEKILKREKDYYLPKNIEYSGRMPVLIHYGFFHTPFNKVFDNEVNHAKKNTSKEKEIICNDLKLKSDFCSMVINDTIIQSEIGFDSQFEDQRLALLISCYGQAFILEKKIRELLGKINGVSNDWNIYEVDINDIKMLNNEINIQYLEFLSALFKAALYPQKCIEVSDENIAERIIKAGPFLKMYESIYFLIYVLSKLEKKSENLSIENTLKLVTNYEKENNIVPNQLEKLLKNEAVESPLLLKTLVQYALNYDSENAAVKLRKYYKDWYELIISNEIYDILAVVVNDNYKRSRNVDEIIRDILSGSNRKVNENLDLLTVKYFSENANDETFIEIDTENTKHVNVNFEPKVNNGHYIYQIPKYAGMYYKYVPSKNIEEFRNFSFQIRSIDQSIKKVTVEIKNKDRIDLDSFKFDVTPDWITHKIEIGKVRSNIKDNVEEIVFLITPSSFSGDNLKGQFEVQSVQLVK